MNDTDDYPMLCIIKAIKMEKTNQLCLRKNKSCFPFKMWNVCLIWETFEFECTVMLSMINNGTPKSTTEWVSAWLVIGGNHFWRGNSTLFKNGGKPICAKPKHDDDVLRICWKNTGIHKNQPCWGLYSKAFEPLVFVLQGQDGCFTSWFLFRQLSTLGLE